MRSSLSGADADFLREYALRDAFDTGNGDVRSATSQAAPQVAGAVAILLSPAAAPDDTLANTVAPDQHLRQRERVPRR
ncbi:hypothetical protein HF313_23715 [Massilia atriviolacea]|uniref:Uncharacterized protein n=1 Tax=Massilia atriviolacea TaxID=2495579 RepID=A0A430HKE2_9BURK|nr:hypothetical protein [Massilia atriviolacea]RSZ57971.1 hypothetical protein EJB06_16775 [Massilia atriviolacea]